MKGIEKNRINDVLFVLIHKEIITVVHKDDGGSWNYHRLFILEIDKDELAQNTNLLQKCKLIRSRAVFIYEKQLNRNN